MRTITLFRIEDEFGDGLFYGVNFFRHYFEERHKLPSCVDNANWMDSSREHRASMRDYRFAFRSLWFILRVLRDEELGISCFLQDGWRISILKIPEDRVILCQDGIQAIYLPLEVQP